MEECLKKMKTSLENNKKVTHLRKGKTMSKYEPECNLIDIERNADKTEFTDITKLTDNLMEVSCKGCKESERYKAWYAFQN